MIGVEAALAIRRMRTGMPVRFRPAEGGVRLEGVLVDCDPDGRATAIEALRVAVSRSDFGRSSTAKSATSVKVAQEHHPGGEGREVEDERPVAEREPELRQHERECERRAGGEPARPRTRTTSGTSQIRNCGESTFPNAMKAQTAAAKARVRRSRVGRPAREPDPDADDREQLQAGEQRRERVGPRPGEVLRAVARLHRDPEPHGLVQREQHAGAERLDLQRAAGLARHAVPHPVRREHEERQEAGEQHGKEHGRGGQRARAGRRAARPRPRRAARAQRGRASPRQRGRARRAPIRSRPARNAASAPTVSAAGQRSKRVSTTEPSRSGATAANPSPSVSRPGPASSDNRAESTNRTANSPQTAITSSNPSRYAPMSPSGERSSDGTAKTGSAAGGYSSPKSR